MKNLIALIMVILFSIMPVTAAKASEVARENTMYGIGSVSKVFTAAAVMKLAEQAKLDIDEPIVTYIPDFEMADGRYVYITPRMLLDHSSGLMGSLIGDSSLFGYDNPDYLANFLDLLKHQRLKHDPGERSIYCNDGFTLAEILIERVSGLSYTDYIEHEFLRPLGIENIKSPASKFDRNRLADIYLGNRALKPQYLQMIGSGGLYATLEDLVRYATIFMQNADGSVLLAQSVNEMAKNQHRMEMLPLDADSMMKYGLGWDAVDTYPFNQLGIQALSKGGDTLMYHTNLTVLPEHNLAVAVSSSGNGSLEQQIAQEIILAVLIDEGLIPADSIPALPTPDLNRDKIPESIKANAGIYNAGRIGGLRQVEFINDTLIISPIVALNERPQEFIYNTDGLFVSIEGDYLGRMPEDIAYGLSWIYFEDDHLILQTYKEEVELGIGLISLPFAEKIKENPLPDAVMAAWEARNDKEYLLVDSHYTSMQFLWAPLMKTLTDQRIPGYVAQGIYRANGAMFPAARIIDANNAQSFIKVPTLMGRDGADLTAMMINGVEYLNSNYGDAVYMDAAAALKFSELGGFVVIEDEAVWVDIDEGSAGHILKIKMPQNGSWFVYDEKMACIASSLEKNPRDLIILPDKGRIAFVGESGVEFLLN